MNEDDPNTPKMDLREAFAVLGPHGQAWIDEVMDPLREILDTTKMQMDALSRALNDVSDRQAEGMFRALNAIADRQSDTLLKFSSRIDALMQEIIQLRESKTSEAPGTLQ